MNTEILDRLENLEMKISFQEDTIEKLNHEIEIHQQIIDKQKRQLELLAKKMHNQTPTVASLSEETPPPHY